MGMGGIKHHKGGGKQSTASSLAALVDPNAEPEFVFLTPKIGGESKKDFFQCANYCTSVHSMENYVL